MWEVMVPTHNAIRNSARALILCDGAVLLQVCRFDDEVVHLLPGGGQEFGEPLAATVRREVLEETGLRVQVGELLTVWEFVERTYWPVAGDGEGEHAVACIFRCIPERAAQLAIPTVPDTAQVDVRWVPLAELPAITLRPDALRRLLIDWDGQAAFSMPAYLGNRL